MKIDNWKLIIVLLLLSSFLFFFHLGSFSLYNAAETTYGEFIKQIRLTGDWVTMHYNGQIIFDKPPLYFWLATATTYLLGFNAWSIRLWAAICGVLTVITTFLLGKSLYNQRTGFLSAIMVMTAFQFLIQSRIAEIDILLTLCMTLGFYSFWQAFKNGKSFFYWPLYISLALATATKGIIGIVFPACAIFLYLLFSRQLPRLKEMKILPGMALFLLIALPWYAAEWILHGARFTEFVLGFLFLSRFQGVVSGHPGPWYYYFLALILGFAPWSHFLPYAFIRTVKKWKTHPELLTLCFILPVFIVFSAAKTKLPNYLLPLYPFLAIMAGKLWDDFLSEEKASMKIGMLVANLLLLVVVILIIIGFMILGHGNYAGPYQEQLPHLLLLAAVLVGGSTFSIFAYFLKAYRTSFASLAIMVFIIAGILTIDTLPIVEQYKGEKELGAKIAEVITASQEIAAYDTGNRPGIVFYSPKPVNFLTDKNKMVNFIYLKKGYCFTSQAVYEEVKNFAHVLGKVGELVVVY